MIRIRKAKKSDLSQLEKLFLITRQSNFYWEKPTTFKLEDYKENTKGETVFVAETVSHKIVGFISIWVHDSPAFIHHLFVSPAYQRKGIGTLLLSHLFTYLAPPYRLKCLVENIQARNFYSKNNWLEVNQGVAIEGAYLVFELND